MGAYWANEMVSFDISKNMNIKDTEIDQKSTPLVGVKVHIVLLVEIVDIS